MTVPVSIALEAEAAVTIFIIRMRLTNPETFAGALSTALYEESGGVTPASFEVTADADFLRVRVLATPDVAAAALASVLSAISRGWPSSPVPLTVTGRGRSVSEVLSGAEWPPSAVRLPGGAGAASPTGAHFSATDRRLHGRIIFPAATPAARTYPAQNLVASVWLGTRDSVVMRRLRERAGLFYFPFMVYDWHPHSPVWSIEFEAEANAEAALRRELRDATEVPAPISDLAAHVRNLVRSLDVVEGSPDAHLALGQQLSDRGLTGCWLDVFRRGLADTTAQDFAWEWNAMMSQIRKMLDD